MYFWNLRELIEHLKFEKNTQKDSMLYVLGFVVLIYLLPALGKLSNANTQVVEKAATVHGPYLSMLETVLSLSGVFFGIAIIAVVNMLFRSNGGENGRFFLDRLLSLSWVIGIRYWINTSLLIVGTGIAFAILHFGVKASGVDLNMLDLLFKAFTGVFLLEVFGCFIYSVRVMNHAFKEISQGPTSSRGEILPIQT